MLLNPRNFLKRNYIKTSIISKVWRHSKVTLGNYAEKRGKKGGIFGFKFFRKYKKIYYEEGGNLESSFGVFLM